jgi:hypothetical protein
VTTTPIADTKTGEIPPEDGEHFRPFAELLTILDHGAAHAEASRVLHDLTNAVVDTGKAGNMIIKIEVKALKGSSSQLVVTAQVASKMPKSEPAASIFYRDNGGNLTRNDPRQPEIDGLRVVAPKTTRVITPPNGA